MEDKLICFEELSRLVTENLSISQTLPPVLVVDVRNPPEIEKHGKIPGAVNLPLKALDHFLLMPEKDFLAETGFVKSWLKSSLLITHCRSGPRAILAANILMKRGYQRLRIYSGSMLDWVANGGFLEKEGPDQWVTRL